MGSCLCKLSSNIFISFFSQIWQVAVKTDEFFEATVWDVIVQLACWSLMMTGHQQARLSSTTCRYVTAAMHVQSHAISTYTSSPVKRFALGIGFYFTVTVHHRTTLHDPSLSPDRQCQFNSVSRHFGDERCHPTMSVACRLLHHTATRPTMTGHVALPMQAVPNTVEQHRQLSLIALLMFVTLWSAEFRYIFVVCLCLVFFCGSADVGVYKDFKRCSVLHVVVVIVVTVNVIIIIIILCYCHNYRRCLWWHYQVGICGRPGCGKSSLTLSLLGMVDICEGHAYIDCVDISRIPPTLLRSRLAILPQDCVLVSGTVRWFQRLTSFSVLFLFWHSLQVLYCHDVWSNKLYVSVVNIKCNSSYHFLSCSYWFCSFKALKSPRTRSHFLTLSFAYCDMFLFVPMPYVLRQ